LATPERASRLRRLAARALPWLPVLIPALQTPLLLNWAWQVAAPAVFLRYRETMLLASLLYIVAVRFALLDVMLFYVAHRRRSLHIDLLRIVFLYLEVTVVTVLFFAFLYHQFGVFDLFAPGSDAAYSRLAMLRQHPVAVALYVSVELFTTLGLGDWVPQTLNAMLAAGMESLLGFIQSGVFFAVLIYAHQERPPPAGGGYGH
jgi:hypothetical protein